MAVFKRIKKGQIKAIKIGRSYAIPKISLPEIFPAYTLKTIPDEYLSIGDATKQLGISHVALFKRIKRGQIKFQKIGHYHVIARKDIQAVLAISQEVSVLLDKEFVSVPELAKILGKNRITILKQVQKGQIPAKKVGRHYVIAREHISGEQEIDRGKYRIKAEDYISVAELAQQLGISRIAVFKKIKKGQIKAIKIGRSYAINKAELRSFF